jgi:hypothetical protein
VQSMQRKKVAIETACGQHVNSAVSPEDLHKLFVQALNSGLQGGRFEATSGTERIPLQGVRCLVRPAHDNRIENSQLIRKQVSTRIGLVKDFPSKAEAREEAKRVPEACRCSATRAIYRARVFSIHTAAGPTVHRERIRSAMASDKALAR